MTFKYCSKCGAEGSMQNDLETINFCPYCGNELKEKKEVEKDEFY